MTVEEIRRGSAEIFIRNHASPHCRTMQEGAKYLVGKLNPDEMPHRRIWWEVVKISKGL